MATVDWRKIMAKECKPPIIPGPNQCCIDKEFSNLPLDFEDSGNPLPTERRQSCYYESTLIIKNFSNNNTRKNSEVNLIDYLLKDKSPLETEANEEAKETFGNIDNDNIFGNFEFINPPQDELELKE